MQRYILTDAGNVLTRFRFRARLVEEILAAFGVFDVKLSEVFWAEGGMVTSDEQYYNGLDTGKLCLYDIWGCLIKRYPSLQDVCTYPLFMSLWCKHLVPIEGVVNLYRELQTTFPLVMVSNGDSEGVRHLVYHLTGTHALKFEKVFISAEYKRKKPELFSDVLAFLSSKDVAPSNCVFVDDLLPYVQAANDLGIPSIQFDGTKQTEQELKNSLARLGFS